MRAKQFARSAVHRPWLSTLPREARIIGKDTHHGTPNFRTQEKIARNSATPTRANSVGTRRGNYRRAPSDAPKRPCRQANPSAAPTTVDSGRPFQAEKNKKRKRQVSGKIRRRVRCPAEKHQSGFMNRRHNL